MIPNITVNRIFTLQMSQEQAEAVTELIDRYLSAQIQGDHVAVEVLGTGDGEELQDILDLLISVRRKP